MTNTDPFKVKPKPKPVLWKRIFMWVLVAGMAMQPIMLIWNVVKAAMNN